MDEVTVARAIAQLPERVIANLDETPQRQLLERILAVLIEDERFMGAWLWGSLSRGEGDASSDVDVYIVVDDRDHPAVVADWEKLIDRISPTLSKALRPFGSTPILAALTPGWQRFDLILVPVGEIGRPRLHRWLLLFDRGDLDRRLGPVNPSPPMSPDDLLGQIENCFWVLGMLTVPIDRQDYLLGIDGAMLLRRTTIDLMLVENGSNGASILRRNQFLTPDQRRQLEALPPLAATRKSVVGHHLACWRIFRPIARRVLEERGLPYPEELEQATLAHLMHKLGALVDFEAPC